MTPKQPRCHKITTAFGNSMYLTDFNTLGLPGKPVDMNKIIAGFGFKQCMKSGKTHTVYPKIVNPPKKFVFYGTELYGSAYNLQVMYHGTGFTVRLIADKATGVFKVTIEGDVFRSMDGLPPAYDYVQVPSAMCSFKSTKGAQVVPFQYDPSNPSSVNQSFFVVVCIAKNKFIPIIYHDRMLYIPSYCEMNLYSGGLKAFNIACIVDFAFDLNDIYKSIVTTDQEPIDVSVVRHFYDS